MPRCKGALVETGGDSLAGVWLARGYEAAFGRLLLFRFPVSSPFYDFASRVGLAVRADLAASCINQPPASNRRHPIQVGARLRSVR